MKTCDVCIVGAGIMGASAAVHAARRGAKVTLVDQAPLPNPRGASVDHSKVFRFAYPDPLYVRMAIESLPLWRELEKETSRTLLTTTGLLLLGHEQPGFETRCLDAMRGQGCDTALLTRDQIAQRFPQFDTRAFAFGVFDPSGAIAHAADAVQATVDLARRLGVSVIEGKSVSVIDDRGVVTTQGDRIACAKILVAAGPWTRLLLSELASLLATTRQEVFYFAPPRPADFDAEKFPIFIELTTGFYCFPVHHRGAMKIANHHKGTFVNANAVDERATGESDCRAFFARYLPAFTDAALIETKVCVYNNTPDDDFIIDWQPGRKNVLIATGFSGHGFKFGPLIGRIAAELLITGEASLPITRFSLARFDRSPSVA